MFLLFHFRAPQVVLFAVHVDRKWSCLALPYGVGLCCNGADFFKLQEATWRRQGTLVRLDLEAIVIHTMQRWTTGFLPLLHVQIPSSPGETLCHLET